MHSSINLKHSPLPFPLTISSISTKSNPQFPPKKPIFFTSLKNPSTFLTISLTPTKPNPQIYHKNQIFFTSTQYSANRYYSNSSSRTKKPNLSSVSCLIMEEPPLDERLSVVDKVQSLSLEFRSLSEPIDRVKRLLHYASILPPLNESSRLQENQVFGCTTQVWLEVRMDNKGYMRFRVDSDSEITKGFCSCLIWVLDGAKPEEILSVTAEDLADMNVGLPKKGRSRVNTWHNVLFSMQNRTQDRVQERNRALSLEDLRSLVIRPQGSYLESEVIVNLSAVSKSNDSQPSFVLWLDESGKVSTSSSFVTDKAFVFHCAPVATSFSFLFRAIGRENIDAWFGENMRKLGENHFPIPK